MNFDLNALGIPTHIYHTLLLFILAMISRYVIMRLIGKSKFNRATKRKLKGHTHNLTILVFIIFLITIWFSELRNFAISFVAIAAALAISTKEYTLNFLGGLYRTVNHPFSLGDRIEIGGIRGDVISINISSTTILEVGPGKLTHQNTGKSITLPNSLFLREAIITETYAHHYLLHVFRIPFNRSEDIQREEELILQAANIECQGFVDKAQKYLATIGEQKSLEMPDAYPRVTYYFPNENSVELIVRVPTPSDSRGTVEKAIINKYFELRKKS